MKDWPEPSNLRKFGGFRKGYANVAHALTQQLKEDSFAWIGAPIAAFQELKRAQCSLTASIVLLTTTKAWDPVHLWEGIKGCGSLGSEIETLPIGEAFYHHDRSAKLETCAWSEGGRTESHSSLLPPANCVSVRSQTWVVSVPNRLGTQFESLTSTLQTVVLLIQGKERR